MAAVGYLGTTKDIAALVSYLVSPEAHYVTGKYLALVHDSWFIMLIPYRPDGNRNFLISRISAEA